MPLPLREVLTSRWEVATLGNWCVASNCEPCDCLSEVLGQVEYVHSYDPRSWSCLHVAEGAFSCTGATIQNNDIGPCGSDVFQEWADGISLSCANSVIRNNTISDPTDGGIVIFGSPGSLIQNNTIIVQNVCIFHLSSASEM